MSQNDKYASQKKYLQNKKQLRVWVRKNMNCLNPKLNKMGKAFMLL